MFCEAGGEEGEGGGRLSLKEGGERGGGEKRRKMMGWEAGGSDFMAFQTKTGASYTISGE